MTKSKGLSLVESMIAMVVVGIIAIVLIRLMQGGGKSIVSSQNQFEAAQLLDYIQAKFQIARFEDVLAVDSGNKNGVTAGNFSPSQYWVRWSSSPIQGMLLDIETRVKAAGFPRFKVEVKFIRRDSADNYANSSVVDFIAFEPLATCSVAAGCVDKYNPEIRFQSLIANAPTEYFYDVDGAGRTEVPDTRMKTLDIYLCRTAACNPSDPGTVMSREGVMLSKEKLSGRAQENYVKDLKLLMTFPVDSSRYYRDRAEIYYGYANGAAHTPGSTIGAGPLANQFFRRDNYAKTSSWSWQLRPGDKTNGSLIPKVAGYSERDAIISLWTSTLTYPPVAAPNYTWTVTADNGYFDNPWSGAFADAVYEEGIHGFVMRAKKGPVGNEMFSPWRIVYMNVDITPPVARNADVLPPPGSNVPNRSPYLKLFLRDEDSGNLIPNFSSPPRHLPGVSGIAEESLSVATMTSPAPAAVGNIFYMRHLYTPVTPAVSGVVSASGTLVAIDTTTLLPYVFPDNQDIYLRAEFGDKTGQKTIKTWTIHIDDMNFDDGTSPDVVVPSTTPPTLSGAPLVLSVSDPESGVDWGSFELFDVDHGAVLLSSVTSPSLGLCLNPATNSIIYTTSTFTPGTHHLRTTVSNWSRGGGTNATTVRNFDMVIQ